MSPQLLNSKVYQYGYADDRGDSEQLLFAHRESATCDKQPVIVVVRWGDVLQQTRQNFFA